MTSWYFKNRGLANDGQNFSIKLYLCIYFCRKQNILLSTWWSYFELTWPSTSPSYAISFTWQGSSFDSHFNYLLNGRYTQNLFFFKIIFFLKWRWGLIFQSTLFYDSQKWTYSLLRAQLCSLNISLPKYDNKNLSW